MALSSLKCKFFRCKTQTFVSYMDHTFKSIIVCLFICLGYFVPLENFSYIWRLHHCRWRAANFDLCPALMVIEQWEFFSVPHLLWHGASICNDYLRGARDTHTYCRAFSSGAVTTRFYDLGFSGLAWDSNTQPSACVKSIKYNACTTL